MVSRNLERGPRALFESRKPATVSEGEAQNLRPAAVGEDEWKNRLKAGGWIAGGVVATAIIIKLLGSYFGLF